MSDKKITTYSIRRHEEKDGDSITDMGRESAIWTGYAIDDLAGVYHSDMNRSKESAEGIIEGFGGIEDIISDSRLNELNPPLPKDKAEQDRIMKLYKADRDAFLQYFADTPDMKKAGNNVIESVFEKMRSYKHSDLGKTYEFITHCPNIEAAALKVVEEITGQRPTIKDIGGHFKPGEGFQIYSDMNWGEPRSYVNIRGKTYNK